MSGGHFSVYRVALAAWLGAGFAIRGLAATDAVAQVVSAAAVLVAVALALGLFTRTAALLAAAAVVHTNATSDLGAVVLTLVPLLLLAALPVAPYGSFDARGRPDPGGGFEIPEGVVRGVVALVAGAALLVSWEERALTDDALVPAWTAATSFFAVLAWTKRTRPVAVLALVLAIVARLVLRPEDPWSAPLLFVLLLAFDEGLVPPLAAAGPDRVFYDGGCGLCHRAVRFALAEDRAGTAMRFAPIESDAFVAAVPEEARAKLPDSIIVCSPDGDVLIRSAAILRVADRVGGLWRLGGRVLRLVPRPVLDALYDRVAAVRHRLFAKPAEVCPIVPPHLRERFDH